jgi:hypothetical protein
MERIDQNSTTWYIVFTDDDVAPHWIHRFIRKGFQHCACFRTVEGEFGDMIYLANPTTANIHSGIIEEKHGEALALDLVQRSGTKVLRFKTSLDFSNRILTIWNMVPTCVSVVKMFLGIRARAQTPYQLYKHLIKLGAEEYKSILF